MIITSPEFEDGDDIPVMYTCHGEDVNPPLDIADVPDGAKSLAIIVEDPDAPGQAWSHWLLWNIPADTEVIEEDVVPDEAIRGMNDFDQLDYGGPCPASGVYSYFFRLYALDRMLDLKEGATRDELEEAMRGHVIEEVELIGTYTKA